MKNLLMTPIDFGKNFIYSLYQDRNAQTAAAALADDIVWVTPDEIFHLKTRKEIQDFTESLVGRHPDPCSVDIASIKSALVPGETNTVVYDVNLIPRREQDTVNLRCSLSICRQGADYRLIYVGMSRRYEPSEADQIREFIENVPMGLMVLAVSTALNAAYFIITIVTLYRTPPHDYAVKMRHHWYSNAALAAFAALIVLMGLMGGRIYALIDMGVRALG